jgi:hypothetical protein
MKAIVDAINESSNLAIWIIQSMDDPLITKSARAILRKNEAAVTRIMEIRKEGE